MSRWSQELEDDLAALLKDWLKQQGRTQSDLRRSLRATSTRMPALMEVLEREHVLGGCLGWQPGSAPSKPNGLPIPEHLPRRIQDPAPGKTRLILSVSWICC